MAEPTTNTLSSPPAPSSSELITFLKSLDSSKLNRSTKDFLPETVKIQFQQPLPQWNAPLAPAYAAKDDLTPNRQLHALLCPSGLPLRQKAIQVLKDFRHPNLMELVHAGCVEVPDTKEIRFALVFETPAGTSLAAMLRDKKAPLPDRSIMVDILTPILDILKKMEDAGISHGRINLDNIFYGDRLILGECVSEPCGFSQPYLFEPLERVIASPLGKGEADANADSFAVGMLALHLTIGSTTVTKLSQDAYIRNVTQLGTYNVLTNDREFSSHMQDLLRGTLNDKVNERWGLKLIQSWLSGKRFNLIPPSPPRDASRSFAFLDGDYASRRALAHALFLNWEQAPEALKDNKLSRWLELSIHRPELADTINKIVRSLGGEDTRNVKQLNEIITRTITVLDPDGPIRMQSVQVRVEGLGSMLADLFINKKQAELALLSDIIENDIPNFWSDLHKDDLSAEVSGILWRLQRVRIWMRQSAMGAGMERCLYDLNPTLTCQSKHLSKYFIQDISSLLYTLDHIAPEKAPDFEVLDRHSAAFICSRLDVQRDLKVGELQNIPTLMQNSKLVSLKLLIQAQEKIGNFKLRGLSAWVAHRLLSLLELIHNRKHRDIIRQRLVKAGQSGDLRQIANVILNESIFKNDASYFDQAVQLFQFYQARIEDLKSEEYLEAQSIRSGHTLAQILALTVCTGVIFFTCRQYLS